MLLYVQRTYLRSIRGRGAQDGHLDFHTAPELGGWLIDSSLLNRYVFCFQPDSLWLWTSNCSFTWRVVNSHRSDLHPTARCNTCSVTSRSPSSPPTTGRSLHRIALVCHTQASIGRTLEPFQRQRWGNVWQTAWSAYGLFRAHRYHLELNWTESTARVRQAPSPQSTFCSPAPCTRKHGHRTGPKDKATLAGVWAGVA